MGTGRAHFRKSGPRVCERSFAQCIDKFRGDCEHPFLFTCLLNAKPQILCPICADGPFPAGREKNGKRRGKREQPNPLISAGNNERTARAGQRNTGIKVNEIRLRSDRKDSSVAGPIKGGARATLTQEKVSGEDRRTKFQDFFEKTPNQKCCKIDSWLR